MEGLISKMRNIHKSTAPSFRRRENAAAIVKAPPPGALTKGLDRKFPGLHPPLGGATSPSFPLNRRFAFPIVAFLAALAAGLLFLLPGGLVQAQDDGTIEYAENGTGAVAAYTAMDPEQTAITSWTLAGTDAAAFMIEGGVLSFAKSPDYENPTDIMGTDGSTAAAGDNSYEITVKAMDSTGKTGEKAVMVDVIDVDEPGTVTLSARRPQVDVNFTASVADLDGDVTNPTWQWAKSSNKNGSYTDIEGAEDENYTPIDAVGKSDIDYYLRATASYTDGEGSGKTAVMNSEYTVQAARVSNNPPSSPTTRTPSSLKTSPMRRERWRRTPHRARTSAPRWRPPTQTMTY